jgi:uncharacterized membrane protein YoaK (UPF0700 family)
MRRIPRFLRTLLRRYALQIMRARVGDPLQVQSLVDAALSRLPMQSSLLTREGGHRDEALNRQLAWSMAFVAGAVNAGGFLAVGHYTSHMTGVVSTMADEAALGEWTVAAVALAMLVAFVAGAFLSTSMVSLGQRLHLRSRYAIGLLVEAGLLLLFGLSGSRLNDRVDFFVPVTVMLLCFIMGLHNALTTNLSGAAVRTTHLTGVVTDIGIELSRLFYFNWRDGRNTTRILADRKKLALVALVFFSFFFGAVAGAIGFKRFGFKSTIPLSGFLCFLAARPVLHEIRVYMRLLKKNLLD